MSAFNMKPKFTTRAEYKSWLKTWKVLYREVSEKIRRQKQQVKDIQRAYPNNDMEYAAEEQRKLVQERAMGAKAMTLLNEARIRWQNIQDMKTGIEEQFSQFPKVIEDARNIDFHFNKKYLEFPDIIPMWIVKAKGTSFYVNHVDCAAAWTTREQPDNPSTKGAIRIKRGTITIDVDGNASIA